MTRAESDPEQERPSTFLLEEAAIAVILGMALARRSGPFIDEFLDTLRREDFQRLDDVYAMGSASLGDILTEANEQAVRKSLVTEVRKGVRQLGGGTLAEVVPRLDDIMNGMVRSTKYYTNTYFNRFVVPSLQNLVQREFIEGAADPAAYQKIQKALDSRLKSVPYWRTVANAAASRSYHYGVMKAGQANGMRGYELVAIMDDRTSHICRDLDGKQFWIEDAVHLIERTAMAEDPEEVKELQPWLKYDDIKDLSTDELVSKGVMMPPFHGSCRTTLVTVAGF